MLRIGLASSPMRLSSSNLFHADHRHYGLSLTYISLLDNHAFSINGDYTITQYDANNPLFNKTQKDNSYGWLRSISPPDRITRLVVATMPLPLPHCS
ncbi:DUF2860 family protein [Vibrio sp. F74]|uniref:DUF2860 family protein n=1 Tax=Vibrio sp. F74 TaxID=700020 RepID=UPI0036F3703F